jgi:hypothetical protein
MVFARRNRLPSHAKVNRAGALSLMSIVRGLELPDNVVFEVGLDRDNKTITLTPTDLTDVPATVQA